MLLKLPPPEKILEAWSAIGAKRIKLLSPQDAQSGEAELVSSDGSKCYKLAWNGGRYSSTDNATVWQGYPGYPVLALLMLRGLLPLPEDLTLLLAPVNWNILNKKAKNNYTLAAREAFKNLNLNAETIHRIDQSMKETYALLQDLDISVSRFRKKSGAKSG